MGRKIINFDGRGEKRPGKVMYDNKGIGQEVPYAQWEQEVIKHPFGQTALRAKEDGDEDLKKIGIDVIQITSAKERLGRKSDPLPVMTPKKRPSYIKPNIDEETGKRLGFREAEDGKMDRQKKKVALLRGKQKRRIL